MNAPEGNELDHRSYNGSTGYLEYFDEYDSQILHDRSNLRPGDMTEFEYRRQLQDRRRGAAKRRTPDLELPTAEDLEMVTMRWFVEGDGVVLQNPTPHRLIVSVLFRSSAEACSSLIPRRAVEPGGSALLTPSSSECHADEAVISIGDGFGMISQRVVGSQNE